MMNNECGNKDWGSKADSTGVKSSKDGSCYKCGVKPRHFIGHIINRWSRIAYLCSSATLTVLLVDQPVSRCVSAG